MHEKNFYTYAMLSPNRIPYTFLSENNVVVTCLAMLYFEKRYMLEFYEVEKRTCVFYIIKQGLNEPPGWTRIL